MELDLLLTNATILTMDEGRPLAHSMGVLHGRVVVLDPDPSVRARRRIDAKGATVTPGFGDAHNHMAWFGLSLTEIDLAAATSLEHLYDLVAQEAASLPEDAYVVGSGYDNTRLGGHPHRRELDRAAGGRSVWLKHRSGHVCAVSSRVLDRVGVLDGSARVPVGGEVVRDADGPTGVLEEQAQNLVVSLVVPYPVETLSRAVTRAAHVYAAEGLTHVTEAGIGGGWLGRSPLELAAYQRAREAGELPVRVQLMPAFDALHELRGDESDDMGFGLDLGMRTGFGDDRLRLGPMKIWLDGSLVARTAAVQEPFCDHGHGTGYLQDDPERMRTAVLDAHHGGWRVAAHAIGDQAVDVALDVFEEAQTTRPRPDVRHRIEHAGITRPEQVERMARLGVTPVPQHRFLFEIGDTMAEAVGDARRDHLYRHASFLDAGMRVPGSSDRPVADGAPLAAMQSMVERLSSSGQVMGPDERVDARTALRAYTVDTAWVAGEEEDRGTLAPGHLADFVILGDDPTAVPTERISSIEVVATFVAGRCIHGEEAVDGR
ncbi:amidohydrolase [Janibacter sp. GS2]|uniref:amidohydrolase n=1 Tax=Janibacter sp. GS2 TaxID=3442646 RepID=UPI003EBCDA9A